MGLQVLMTAYLSISRELPNNVITCRTTVSEKKSMGWKKVQKVMSGKANIAINF